MDTSDVTLLRKWQRSSDSEAFARIVTRHSAMVFATCNRILRNVADAEDVTQECFMELGGVRTLVGNSLGGLLHTLATHRSLDRVKREARRREREIRYAMGRPTSCTVGWDDIYPHIDEAIANLPMKYRDAVIRHFLEGQTHSEVAASLGIADSTVRYRIKKGIKHVRLELHHRGVIVSDVAMDTALDESKAETISASLSASLGKLSVAGSGTSTTAATTLAGGAVLLKKALGISVVVVIAGFIAWSLTTETPAPAPAAVRSAEAPPVDSVETERPEETVSVAVDDAPDESLPLEVPFVVAKAMEPLEIALPEAFFGGTPLDYWGPNLEPEVYTDRPPFLAPRGTAIISRGKPVTASVDPAVGDLVQLTDGDKNYAKTSLIELPEGVQWVQVDLEESSVVYAVLLWKFHEGKRIYFDLVVQLSDDPEFGAGVTTLYNNDFDNTAALGAGTDKEYIESNKGRLIDAEGAKGRYLRVYGNGSTASGLNHFIEVEIWGTYDSVP